MKARYKLIEGDHGMGNMGEYKTRIVAHFTNLERAMKFFKNNDLTVDSTNKPQEFEIGCYFYVKGHTRGLGVKDYILKPLVEPAKNIDPKSLEDL